MSALAPMAFEATIPLPVPMLRPRLLAPESVLAIAAAYFGTTEEVIVGERRWGHVIDARSFAAWSMRSLGRPRSYHEIGCILGGRDHSTAANLHRRAIRLRLTDLDFSERCTRMEKLFQDMRS